MFEQLMKCPTIPFKILHTQNQEIGEIYAVHTVFEAQKLWKGHLGGLPSTDHFINLAYRINGFC